MSPRPRSWRAPSPLREVSARRLHHARRQRHVTAPRAGAGHGGRRPLRTQGRSATAPAPDRVAEVALVTGTNGKTTTTRLLAVALGAGGATVVSNETGSNMPPGHVAALAGNRRAPPGGARGRRDLPAPRAGRHQARRGGAPQPLARSARPHQRGPDGVGPLARRPGRGAPRHGGRQRRRPAGGLGCRCGRPGPLGRGRPALAARCGGLPLVRRSHRLRRRRLVGLRHGVRVRPARPLGHADGDTGRRSAGDVGSTTYRGSGPMGDRSRSGCCSRVASTTPTRSWPRWPPRRWASTPPTGWPPWPIRRRGGGALHHPPGGWRAHPPHAGQEPAGWSELLDLVGKDDGPIVISINARTADGADPSWLWDVPFERLAPAWWWPPGTGAATCRCACTTPGWPT
jgi:hypothetical protein